MRILVTGANGFVGHYLIGALRERGDEVIGAGHHGDGAVDVPFDLTDQASIDAAVARVQPQRVFHLAAQSFVPTSLRDPLATYETNVLGTARICGALQRFAEREQARPRLIFISSSEVYGARARDSQPLRESDLPEPLTPYAASKFAAEMLVRAAVHSAGLDAVITRACNHIGPGQNERFVVPSFALQLARIAAGGAPVLKVGNLEAERDFLDVRDVVTAYIAVAERGESGAVYNVCSGRPVKIKEILRRLIMIAGVPVEVREDPERMRPADIARICGDASLLTRTTGWKPTIPLDRSLAEIYAAARERVAQAV